MFSAALRFYAAGHCADSSATVRTATLANLGFSESRAVRWTCSFYCVRGSHSDTSILTHPVIETEADSLPDVGDMQHYRRGAHGGVH